MKTENLVFHAKFYVIVGNNGNHTGHNRVWTVWAWGYEMKIKALNDLRAEIANNGDMKYGLTPSRIVSADELEDMMNNSGNQFNYHNCHDIS